MKSNPGSHVYLIEGFSEKKEAHVAGDCIKALLKAHKTLAISSSITLFISCPGGDMNKGLAICSVIEYMRREGRTVIGHVMGAAHSFGLIILQHCDVRRSEEDSGFVAHEMQISDFAGNTTQLKMEYDFIHCLEQEQLVLWASRSGKTLAYFQEQMKGRDWMFNAKEALAEGLIDEIIPRKPFKANKKGAA